MIKKILLIISLFLSTGSLYPQVYFETGKIAIQVSNYGSSRIYFPAFGSVQQINRLSAVVGVNINDVFGYGEDAQRVDSAKLINSPTQSDFEIYNSTDNSYSNLPPALLNKINVYGWSNEAYAIIKLTVLNQDAILGDVSAFIGFEFIPKVDNIWGTEAIKTIQDKEIISVYRNPSSSVTGLKILSAPLFSATYYNWFEDYDLKTFSDSMFYAYLSSGIKQNTYEAPIDGGVGMFCQNAINIKLGESAVVYVAVAVGVDETEMVSNMDKAESKYEALFANVPVEMSSFKAAFINSKVILDWSTATETNNFGFNIERKIEDNNWDNIGFVNGNGTTTDIHKYNFIDEKIISSGNYSYRIVQLDFDGTSSYSKEVRVNVSFEPVKFELLQNYPNPFNNSTVIRYQIPNPASVSLKIFDALGREVKNLVDNKQDTGSYEINFNAADLSSGLYLLVLQADNFKSTKKMFLLK